jgi:hypothetical protein
MVRLTIQKKIKGYNNKKFSLLGLTLLASNPSIDAWYSGLCEEGCCLSYQTAWGGDGWMFYFVCFFSAFLDLMGSPL